MHRKRVVTAVVLVAAIVGCHRWGARPLSQPVVVEVTSTDPAQALRFALDVDGGPAELESSGLRGGATDARLESTTPAAIVLRPGTRAAVFRVLGPGNLEVTATAPTARLYAKGDVVRFASTRRGLEIRDH
jgi:hypothetical protein